MFGLYYFLILEFIQAPFKNLTKLKFSKICSKMFFFGRLQILIYSIVLHIISIFFFLKHFCKYFLKIFDSDYKNCSVRLSFGFFILLYDWNRFCFAFSIGELSFWIIIFSESLVDLKHVCFFHFFLLLLLLFTFYTKILQNWSTFMHLDIDLAHLARYFLNWLVSNSCLFISFHLYWLWKKWD